MANVQCDTKVTAYTDDKCTAGETNLATGQCFNSADGWKAWSMKCD